MLYLIDAAADAHGAIRQQDRLAAEWAAITPAAAQLAALPDYVRRGMSVNAHIPDPASENRIILSLLEMAISRGHLEVADVLVAWGGADVFGVQRSSADVPLLTHIVQSTHRHSQLSERAVVVAEQAFELLLRLGAEVRGPVGSDAMLEAMIPSRRAQPLDMVRALLEAGADPNGITPDQQRSLVAAAALMGSISQLQLLEAYGAQVHDVKTLELGGTILHPLLVEWRRACAGVGEEAALDYVAHLVRDLGVDPRVRDDQGLSALDIADSMAREEAGALFEQVARVLRDSMPAAPGLPTSV